MRSSVYLVAVGLAIATFAAAQEMPPELTALAAKARLEGRLVAWCRAEFRAGSGGAFAVAVTSTRGGGRYVALDTDGIATELGTFAGSADLSCYRRAEAEKLDASIRQSDVVHGRITPRWNTTVVCGFADDTEAVCWQYSPADRAFVEVGRWMT